MQLSDTTGVTIENVSIDACHDGIGLIDFPATPAGTLVRNVSVSNCGSGVNLDQNGGNTASGSTISNCRFYKITGPIAAASLVFDCTADSCNLPANISGLSGGVISRCSIINTSGQLPFILGGTVSECFVSGCTGANGIAGRVITRSAVAELSSPTLIVIGINAAIVEGCHVSGGSSAGGLYGIVAPKVIDCRVDGSNATGGIIGISISGFEATDGDSGVQRSSVRGPLGSAASNIGIQTFGGAVEDCHVSSCSSCGISTSNADVRNSSVTSCNVGIFCANTGSGSRVDGNTISSCAFGVTFSGSTLIVRNYFKGSTQAVSGDTSTAQIGDDRYDGIHPRVRWAVGQLRAVNRVAILN